MTPSAKLIATLLLFAFVIGCAEDDDPPAPTGGGGGGGTGTAQYNWAGCPVDQRPIWFAYQDGDGDWTPMTSSSGQYSFTISADKGGVAYVLRDSEGRETTNIEYKSAAALNGGYQACPSAGTTRTAFGTANGLSSNDDEEWFDQGRMHLGPAAVGLAFAGESSFVLTGSWNGPEDLFAYRSRFSFGGTPPAHSTDRCIIRRNQNPANGATLPMFDFNGTEAFTAATSTLTITGGTPQQIDMTYIASGDCLLKDGASVLYSDIDVSGTNVIAGIPAARQLPGELHCLSIHGSNVDWIALRLFATMGPQTVQVPSMAAPTVAPLPAGYARFQANYTVPSTMYAAPYGNTLFAYEQTNGNKVSVFTSFELLDAQTVSSVPPELEGLEGWDPAWWPLDGQPGTWKLSVQSIDFDCHEEGTSFTLMKNGTY